MTYAKVLLVILLSYSTLTFARVDKSSNQFDFKKAKKSYTGMFSRLQTDKMNFHEFQMYHKELTRFYIAVERDMKFQSTVKTTYLEKLLKKVSIQKVYAANGSCFFGGWPSQLINGVCKAPWTHGDKEWKKNHPDYHVNLKTEYNACGRGRNNLFRCSPLLFGGGSDGQGHCINTGGTYYGLTQKCVDHINKPGNENQLDEVYNTLMEGERAAVEAGKPGKGPFRALVDQTEEFCTKTASSDPMNDHVKTCNALKARIDQVQSKLDREVASLREAAIANQRQAIEKVKNKALGILDACKKHYEDSNDNFAEKMVASTRAQNLTVIKDVATCPRDEVEPVTDDEFNQIKATFDQIDEHIAPMEILKSATLDGVELSLKSLMVTMHQYSDEDLDSLKNEILDDNDYFNDETYKSNGETKTNPFKQRFDKAFDEFRSQKNNIPKVSKATVLNDFRGFREKVNQACHDIRSEYDRRTRLGEDEEGYIETDTLGNNQDEDDYYNKKQTELNTMLSNFSKESKHSRLLFTKEFRKTFPFTGKMAEKCAEGDITTAFSYPTEENYDQSVKDFKQMMLDDLSDLDDKAEASLGKAAIIGSSGDSEANEELKDIFKYKPYLLGNALKGKSLAEQEVLAKYICRESLEVFNSDEKWRIGELAVAGVGLVASGVLAFTGVGTPLATAITAGSFLLVEGTIAGIDYIDGDNAYIGAATGRAQDRDATLTGTDQVSISNYSGLTVTAEDQMTMAKANAALALLEPIAILAKPAYRLTKGWFKARKAKPGNALAIADDIKLADGEFIAKGADQFPAQYLDDVARNMPPGFREYPYDPEMFKFLNPATDRVFFNDATKEVIAFHKSIDPVTGKEIYATVRMPWDDFVKGPPTVPAHAPTSRPQTGSSSSGVTQPELLQGSAARPQVAGFLPPPQLADETLEAQEVGRVVRVFDKKSGRYQYRTIKGEEDIIGTSYRYFEPAANNGKGGYLLRTVRDEAMTNSQLDDAARAAGLRRDIPGITDEQIAAVRMAHEGVDESGQVINVVNKKGETIRLSCRIAECTRAQLAAKQDILRNSGLLSDQYNEIIRLGYAGKPNPNIAQVADDGIFSKFDFNQNFSAVPRTNLPAEHPNADVAKAFLDIGHSNEAIVTVNRLKPDGTVTTQSVRGTIRGSTNGDTIVVESIDGTRAINLNDPNLSVASIDIPQSHVVDGQVIIGAKRTVFETNPYRSLNNSQGRVVEVTYKIDDDLLTTSGEVVEHQGRMQIRSTNQYNGSQYNYIPVDEIEGVQEVSRRYTGGNWNGSSTHYRELDDIYVQGQRVQVVYLKPKNTFGSETVETTLDGRYLGVVQHNGAPSAAVRNNQGVIEYIPVHNTNTQFSGADYIEEVFDIGGF